MTGFRYYTNIDINSVVTPFLNRAAEEARAGKDDPEKLLFPFVDVYAGTQITDVLFDIFCQYSNTDSSVWSDYAFKYEQKKENGVDVDYKDRFEGLYTFHKQFGIDPYKVWFDRCRKDGLSPWISIRMNDSHCPDETACFLRSEYFYEAKEKGYMVGEKYGYYRNCFDYAAEDVRKRMLDYIREQICHYDVDGLELDFSRELICFDYVNNKECIPVMNQFMRDAKQIVTEAEKIHGHKIRIGVRLMRDYRQCKGYGFDPETWVTEQLVDLLCACPRWATCDSDMPIGTWKKAFPDTEIAAGVTDLILRSGVNIGHSVATIAAYADRYLSDSADSMYLFNFFINPYDTDRPYYQTYDHINRTCGHLDTVLKQPLRHIVTYQDAVPDPFVKWKPLPKTLEDKDWNLPVNLGTLPEGRKYAVLLGFREGSPEDADISINGKKLSGFVPAESGFVESGNPAYADKETVLYRTEAEDPRHPVLHFSFRKKEKKSTVILSYLEIEAY